MPELCASGKERQDHAVALARTEAIAVPLAEVREIVQKNRDLLQELVQMFCESLSDAYDQLNTLASSDTVHRLVRVLLRLGAQLGRDISVDHSRLVENYRSAHEIALQVGKDAATREDLRTAMIHYRSLFEELVQLPAAMATKEVA